MLLYISSLAESQLDCPKTVQLEHHCLYLISHPSFSILRGCRDFLEMSRTTFSHTYFAYWMQLSVVSLEPRDSNHKFPEVFAHSLKSANCSLAGVRAMYIEISLPCTEKTVRTKKYLSFIQLINISFFPSKI